MPEGSSISPDPLARYSRTIDFIGREGFDALRRSFAVVVGQGGVGSHASLALVRSGIGRLRIIDCDKVQASNLNRHAVALPEDIDGEKVEVMRRHLLRVCPEANIEAVSGFARNDTVGQLLAGDPHYVVDAIDGLNAKVALLRYCVEHDLKVVSSMGASARSDPSALRVGPIETTSGCPLARLVRKRLRRQGVMRNITAVYSVEPKRAPLPPDEGETMTEHGRIRNRLPSLSTLPGIFGYAAATVVINHLAFGSAATQGESDG